MQDDNLLELPAADDLVDGDDELLLHEWNDIGLALRVQALRELTVQ